MLGIRMIWAMPITAIVMNQTSMTGPNAPPILLLHSMPNAGVIAAACVPHHTARAAGRRARTYVPNCCTKNNEMSTTSVMGMTNGCKGARSRQRLAAR
jgi:hypothetical protein